MYRLSALLLLALVGLASARTIPEVHSRAGRDPGPYAPSPVAYHAPAHHGKVGPVYTFVKTDPQANYKWGLRHRAGVQGVQYPSYWQYLRYWG